MRRCVLILRVMALAVAASCVMPGCDEDREEIRYHDDRHDYHRDYDDRYDRHHDHDDHHDHRADDDDDD